MNMCTIRLEWRQKDRIFGRLFSRVITDGVDINLHKNKTKKRGASIQSFLIKGCICLILLARGDTFSNRITISNYINDKWPLRALLFPLRQHNRSFSRSRNSHYTNEAACKTFFENMSSIYMRINNRFHSNGFAYSLALKQRLEVTRECPTAYTRWSDGILIHIRREYCSNTEHI